jgi:hypothetical protein
MNRAAIAAAWLLVAPVVSLAHHSGLYDEDNVIAIEGTITAIEWINPHVRLTLETTAENGGDELWQVEGTSVNALQRWGIERDRFQVGDRISVEGPRSRFERKAMIGATVRLPSGEQVVLWPNIAARLGLADTGVAGLFPPPAEPGSEPVRGIFRVWTPRGRPGADVDALPLTDRARQAAQSYDALDDDPALRCIPPGMPAMLDTPYPVEFIDRGDEILMRFEEWDGERTLYMKPGKGPPVGDHSPKGVSFGRWEGEALAIFTTYIDYPYFDDLGTPQSRAVTVLERYTPSEGETRLDWQVTVTDPATFTEPIVRHGFMAWEPGEQIKPYDCTLLDPYQAVEKASGGALRR